MSVSKFWLDTSSESLTFNKAHKNKSDLSSNGGNYIKSSTRQKMVCL